MKAFFAQIDWIRNTFFFMFYFFLVMIVFISIIQPSLDTFRQTNTKYHKDSLSGQIAKKWLEAIRNYPPIDSPEYTKFNCSNVPYQYSPVNISDIDNRIDIEVGLTGLEVNLHYF